MAEIKERPNKIARRYGGVLFELAQQRKKLKEVLRDVKRLHSCIEAEPQDWMRLVSPSLPPYTQRRIVEQLSAALKFDKLMKNFLMILCQHHRLSDVALIFQVFLERVKQAEGILDGILETPFKLKDQEVKDLQKSLSSHWGEKIHLHQHINRNLMGGVILRLGSLMIDKSTRTQLNKLKTVMKGQ